MCNNATLQNVETRTTTLVANLKRLFEPGQIIELRCLGSGPAHSGFFDDFEALAAHALAAEAEGFACYFGLNPRRIRSCFPGNDLQQGKAAGEEDVLRRRWLLIDVDPIRPADVCSTGPEKASAKTLLEIVVEWLCNEHAWPAPLIADSGNGWHALFRVVLSVKDDGLVEPCLSALAERFDTPEARIDTAVFDAPRICRLYGTKNCKGEDTQERPHRVSRLIGGDAAKPVPVEKLQALAAFANKGTTSEQVDAGSAPGDPVDHCAANTVELLADTQPGLSAAMIIDDAWTWMETQDLAVGGNGGHNRTFALACGLVTGHGLSVDEARPILDEYNTKLEEAWTEAELRHKLNDAVKKAQEEPGRVGSIVRRGPGSSAPRKKRVAQVDGLMEILSHHELWHTPGNKPFATVALDGHEENMPIKSEAFRHWLGGEFYAVHRNIAKSQPITDATNTAIGLAIHEGPGHEVFLRLAGHNGNLYLDLGDSQWRSVEIDKEGWQVISKPPVKFRRTPGMQALPEPVRGGSIGELRPFLNLACDEDFALVVAWLLMGFHPEGEYPILVLGGQQGTSKSTMARVLRSLIDPNEAELRSLPRTEDDFSVEASNNRIVVFDNLSWIADWLSDALCRLSSGGANCKRQLYQDSDEVILRYCGPAIINGVVDLARRPDLLDRSILIDLPVLETRQTKRAFWAAFEKVRPRILGALLDALVFALKNPITIDNPRMAEFAEWASSAEPALARQWNTWACGREQPSTGKEAGMEESTAFDWKPGALLRLYQKNIATATTAALDQHIVASFLIELAQREEYWEGPATDLLVELHRLTLGTKVAQGKGWPKTPGSLGMILQRLTPSLAAVGVNVEKEKETTGRRGRLWIISLANNEAS